MPQDNPGVGEVWACPTQSFDNSFVDDQAVIVDIRDGAATLYARNGRRIMMPVRSLHIMWRFVRALEPRTCNVAPCANSAWFTGRTPPGDLSVCWAHVLGPQTYTSVEFIGGDGPGLSNQHILNCPACNTPTRYPGSGSTTVDEIEIHSCGACRRDWAVMRLAGLSQIPGALDHIQTIAGILEDRGLVARVRAGNRIYSDIVSFMGLVGDPPSVFGIPITVVTTDPTAIYVIGNHREARGVQRLGGLPDQSPELPPVQPATETYTNANIPMGSVWWSTGYSQAHVIEINDQRVRFRFKGISNVLSTADFMARFQRDPPPPPCALGDEWVDTKGTIVTVKEIQLQAALVVDSGGRMYQLPYDQFDKWRKVSRKSVYERLVDDTEETGVK